MVPVYAREIGEFGYEMTGAGVAALGPAPVIRSDLARVQGADVFLIFVESYGAVAWNAPDYVRALAESRARLEADIRETDRGVVSAFVESTTFGGESWLAHISLLSGTEVRDNRTNVRLMAQERDTLVKLFGRRGYRTLAITPGLLVDWPEGRSTASTRSTTTAGLPTGGRRSDGGASPISSRSRASINSRSNRSHATPRSSSFPRFSTHAPFTPAPPYQPSWRRVLSATPYDRDELDRAWSWQPDWLDLGPSYVEALRYIQSTVGGYLRLRADRDVVMILVGDHQPPALVSGEGASWDVPVHVIASRPAVLDRLRRHRFTEGLVPQGSAIARMDTLLPLLLDAFGDEVPAATANPPVSIP